MTVLRSEGAGESGGDFYGYKIGQSLRFNDNDSAYLHRTVGTTGNRKTWTFSCWLKGASFAGSNVIWATSQQYDTLRYTSTGKFMLLLGNTSANLQTTALFRDPSAWYNLVLAVDTTQSTSTDRVKFYVNGSQITSFSTSTYPSQNYDTGYNHTSYTNAIGRRQSTSSLYWDSYLAEVNFIDGTALTADSFGETKDGIWIPKSSSGLTFGTNGFYLPFDDSSAIGDDESSNTNDFTVVNLAASDVVLDSPTNNWCTLNPIDDHDGTPVFSEGNLRVSIEDNAEAFGTFGVSSGKWYWEIRHVSSASNNNKIGLGIADADNPNNNGEHNYGHQSTTYAAGDILAVAVDVDNTTFTFYKNNTAIETNTDWSSKGFTTIVPFVTSANSAGEEVCIFNFGQDSSFAGAVTAQGNSDDNGVGDFYYSPPSGYLALCADNLPDITIGPGQSSQAEDNFNTVLYTGDGSTQGITGVGFSPDWVWIKERSSTSGHSLFDVIRGAGEYLSSHSTSEEDTSSTQLTSFDADGFTTGASGATNQSSQTYVAWNWLAGTAFSNDAGANGATIASTGQVNTTAGFSITSYTGNTTAGATVAHGLSSAPEAIILKARDNARDWRVYHSSLGATKTLDLNTTGAVQGPNAAYWNNTAPTSSVFSVGNVTTVNGAEAYIAYCFHSVDGYSKFGSYTGNGSSNGTFVYTGFRPAWVMVKKSSATGNWLLHDTVRDPFNPIENRIYPNLSDAELDAVAFDSVSNGFKIRNVSAGLNTNGATYVYLAFAESPFKFANAR